jgi:hypothetical protein
MGKPTFTNLFLSQGKMNLTCLCDEPRVCNAAVSVSLVSQDLEWGNLFATLLHATMSFTDSMQLQSPPWPFCKSCLDFVLPSA